MKQFILFFTLLATIGTANAQDLTIFYEVVSGFPTSTVLVKMRNNTVSNMDIGAVNFSIVYRTVGLVGNLATFSIVTSDEFEAEWPGSFLKNLVATEPLGAIDSYGGTDYNARWQYGNTDNDFGSPTFYTLAPGVKTTVMEVEFLTPSGTGSFRMEDESENLLNEIADQDINGISYDIQEDGAAFPVEWLTFEAKQITNSLIELDWETGQETNNSHFQIERSTDNVIFSQVGKVNGAGTIDYSQQYNFMDSVTKARTYYYRIRQVDFDGQFEYSDTRQVEITNMDILNLEIYPNPATEKLTISAQIDQPDGFHLIIADMTGRVLLEKNISKAGEFQLAMNISELIPGIYNVSLIDGYGQAATSARFIKK
ncbi:MAG: T9SS type A sorting domain-containing protein [Bacteroidetes bacterium]|nr:T9SS type A sorting domain-containing protein [Bacteroidota bacterium]